MFLFSGGVGICKVDFYNFGGNIVDSRILIIIFLIVFDCYLKDLVVGWIVKMFFKFLSKMIGIYVLIVVLFFFVKLFING